jgi:hypothetical protein
LCGPVPKRNSSRCNDLHKVNRFDSLYSLHRTLQVNSKSKSDPKPEGRHQEEALHTARPIFVIMIPQTGALSNCSNVGVPKNCTTNSRLILATASIGSFQYYPFCCLWQSFNEIQRKPICSLLLLHI